MITITISGRTIKFATIIIALLILVIVTLPASSAEKIKVAPPTLKPGITNPGAEMPPDFGPLPEGSYPLTVHEVMMIGNEKIGDNRHGWANVYVSEDTMTNLGLITRVVLVYIPTPRVQTLLETAKISGYALGLTVHPIENPEGWTRPEQYQLFEIDSATLLNWKGVS